MNTARWALARMRTVGGAGALLSLVVAGQGQAQAQAQAAAAPGAPLQATATFALIIGVNASPDPKLPPLQYADDDAARYLDLFRALGARTYLLTRVDANTARLHPQAIAEAIPPRRDELRRVVVQLARDLALARSRGVRTLLYVAYAGHGQVRDGIESLTLEDGPLTGTELLRDVAGRVGADQTHLLIDACQAYLLAFARGPGGEPRELHGFVELAAASQSGRVGYVLASSPSGESHEWAGFQAGIFSHEVRSGLYGAADADGDGLVSYAEIAAFVTRANQGVANERFRPQVLARPPAGGDTLVDLRSRREREVRVGGELSSAHYLLEDARGVRILDFHGSAGHAVRLVRPAVSGPLYLRRSDDGTERLVPPAAAAVEVSDLPVHTAEAQARGAAQLAFGELFALPFDEATVGAWTAQAEATESELRAQEQLWLGAAARVRNQRIAGFAALGLAAGLVAGGTAAFISAHGLHDGAPFIENQPAAAARNRDIDARNHLGMALIGGAVVAGAAGAVFFWRATRVAQTPQLGFGLAPSGVDLTAAWNF